MGARGKVIRAIVREPPDSVPADITVIVSSSITKSGSIISGNVPKMVIVHTDPATNGIPVTRAPER